MPDNTLMGLLELLILAANAAKLFQGGWIPLVIAAAIVAIMHTWKEGTEVTAARRAEIEGPLDAFIDEVHAAGVQRVPGLAVYLHPDARTVPLALRNNYAINRVLHERIAIVSVVTENVPHIRHVERARVNDLGTADDCIFHIEYHVGFTDSQDVPRAVYWGSLLMPDVELDPEDAWYFMSVLRLQRSPEPVRFTGMQRSLYLWLAANSANRGRVYHLPPGRTVVMGGALDV